MTNVKDLMDNELKFLGSKNRGCEVFPKTFRCHIDSEFVQIFTNTITSFSSSPSLSAATVRIQIKVIIVHVVILKKQTNSWNYCKQTATLFILTLSLLLLLLLLLLETAKITSIIIKYQIIYILAILTCYNVDHHL